MRRLILLLVLIAAPAFGQGRITEADVHGFLARQEQAWNAARLDAYFAGFTPDATFTDQPDRWCRCCIGRAYSPTR